MSDIKDILHENNTVSNIVSNKHVYTVSWATSW
jgi:hypothetical protein